MKAPESSIVDSNRPLLRCFPVIIIAILTFLGGCSVMNKKNVPSPTVYLTKTLQWQLPEIGLLPSGEYVLTQSVQATYGNETADLLFHIEKQSDRLAIAALTPGGQPLVQLVYEHEQVTGHMNPLVPAEFSLPHLVSDFLLTYSRVEALRAALDQYSVTLEQKDQNRIIQHQGEPIINIQYSRKFVGSSKEQWPTEVMLHNQTLGYQLSIQTLSYSLL